MDIQKTNGAHQIMDTKGLLTMIFIIFALASAMNLVISWEISSLRNQIAIDEKVSILHAHEIEQQNQTINQLKDTINQIDNRTTTNIPINLHNFYVVGDPLQTMINQCVMTQGQNSKVCKAEMKIDKDAFYHPTIIETTEHSYTFASDNWNSWCRLTTDEFESSFIFDLNNTEAKQKCQVMWSSMK